ncbi:MAG: hypothetical protein HDR75_05485 [Bacteroides sp.]|nr:hypothetical protein [Bacteroides sp.]
MNTPFEILENPTQQSQPNKKRAEQSFTASTGRRMSFAAASLSVAMSMVALDCHTVEDKYRPIFAGTESFQNELVIALGNDYEVQSKLLQKLETLKESLSENWNGEGDCPIEEKAYNNTKTAIKCAPGVMLRHWRLFPNPNGTLLFSPKNKSIAGISIGNDEFSYAVFVSDDRQISGKEPFTEQAFQSALKQIHRILGYI